MLSYEKETRNLGKIRLVGGESLISLPVKFSKDSRYFFCCGGSNVYVFSSETGSLVRELKEHSGEVTGFCVNSKNEFQLISCGIDGEIIIWDYTDGAILKKFNVGIQLFGVITHSHHEDSIFLVRNSVKGKKIKQKLAVLDLKDAESSKETDLENLFSFSGSPWNCVFSKKGKLIAYVNQNELGIWNTKTKESKSFTYKESIFTCIAFHPNELCIATGDNEGKIVIWQGVFTKSPVTMEFHWHAHAVTSLAFSYDGSQVISGGQESVLVVWQYSTNTKQFLPRMGAPISHISCSKDDKSIAVCLQDNVIKLISALDLSLKSIVQGLRKASFMCKKLVFDPRSGSLVLNSSPGVLQFYDPIANKGMFVVDIVKQNVISNTETEKLYFTQVHFVSFTDDGKWMATIEHRNDHYVSDETRLKFWEFNSTTQCYAVNTVIDMPHDRPTIALAFQPLNKNQPLAVTAGRDGKFKIWVLRQNQIVAGTKTSWVCQSVGYYNDTPCLDTVFSEDGELLAIAYSNLITLWTPNANMLQKTLHLPFPDDVVRYFDYFFKIYP
ncbi:WD repeat-containing protein 75 [Exaiptasia diaphana]|nr:WD repeat-containing protein 75 [Exaiptasia diaphana]